MDTNISTKLNSNKYSHTQAQQQSPAYRGLWKVDLISMEILFHSDRKRSFSGIVRRHFLMDRYGYMSLLPDLIGWMSRYNWRQSLPQIAMFHTCSPCLITIVLSLSKMVTMLTLSVQLSFALQSHKGHKCEDWSQRYFFHIVITTNSHCTRQ